MSASARLPNEDTHRWNRLHGPAICLGLLHNPVGLVFGDPLDRLVLLKAVQLSFEELIVVQPPRIMWEAGLVPADEKWIITGALYGLTTAPRDWAGDLRWHQEVEQRWVQMGLKPLQDANVRAICEVLPSGEFGDTWGYVAVYVDDILTIGARGVTNELGAAIQRMWPTSEPEHAEPAGVPMKFLGIEIQRLAQGDYMIHQQSYTKELLIRHRVEAEAHYVRVPEGREETPTLQAVREAQRIGGELLWLSGKTRSDIAARMSQLATKCPSWSIEMGQNILAYLNTTWQLGLH